MAQGRDPADRKAGDGADDIDPGPRGASPASAAALAASTRLPPAVRNRNRRPLVPWNRIDFTIWSTATPASAAAASAVRISPFASTGSASSPAAFSAAATRASDFDMPHLRLSGQLTGALRYGQPLTLPPRRRKVAP